MMGIRDLWLSFKAGDQMQPRRRSKAFFQTDGDLLTEHGRRLRIWSAEISPGGADDVIEVALRQVLRVARVVQLQP